MSGQLLNYIQQARRSSFVQQEYGKILTETEFFRVVIKEWIEEKAPYIHFSNVSPDVPEFLELNKIKEKNNS